MSHAHSPKTIELETLDDQPDNFEHFLSPKDAAAQLGVTRRTFDRYWTAKRIAKRYRTKDARYWFDPEDVERIADDIAEERSENALDAPTAALFSQVYRHNELLIQEVKDLVGTLKTMASDNVSQLQERVRMFDGQYLELVKSQQEALNDSAMRSAVVAGLAAEEQRKDQGMALLQTLAPKVLENYTAKKHPALGFFNSITTEQLEFLAMAGLDTDGGMLTRAQLDFVEKEIARRRKAEPAQQAAEPPPAQPPPAPETPTEPAPTVRKAKRPKKD